MKQTIFTLLSVGLVLTISGCSTAPANQAATTAVTAVPSPTVDPAVIKAKEDEAARIIVEEEAKKKAEAEEEAAKVSAEADVISKIQVYMSENFGGGIDIKFKTSWYDHIKEFAAHKSGEKFTIVVSTDLYPKDSNKSTAKPIETAIRMWDDKDAQIGSVIIYASDNITQLAGF